MVGPDEARELGLSRKGQEIHEQRECDHFAVAEAGFGPGQALPAAWAWYQSSTQTYTTVAKSSNAILRAMGTLGIWLGKSLSFCAASPF